MGPIRIAPIGPIGPIGFPFGPIGIPFGPIGWQIGPIGRPMVFFGWARRGVSQISWDALGRQKLGTYSSSGSPISYLGRVQREGLYHWPSRSVPRFPSPISAANIVTSSLHRVNGRPLLLDPSMEVHPVTLVVHPLLVRSTVKIVRLRADCLICWLPYINLEAH